MANRQWELKEMLEAVRAQMRECEVKRFETAHGHFWFDKDAEEKWHALRDREKELMEEKAK